MSFVPFKNLKPSNSLELKTFVIQKNLSGTDVTADMIAEYGAYYRAITIRNFSDSELMYYRTQPNAPFDALPNMAERKLAGWGSFLEVKGVSMSGIIIVECVLRGDALLVV